MMKYLLLFALLGVVWWMWKKRSEVPPEIKARRDPAPEKMVVCAHCGVHLPESDSVADGEANYCTPAHRDAARAARS